MNTYIKTWDYLLKPVHLKGTVNPNWSFWKGQAIACYINNNCTPRLQNELSYSMEINLLPTTTSIMELAPAANGVSEICKTLQASEFWMQYKQLILSLLGSGWGFQDMVTSSIIHKIILHWSMTAYSLFEDYIKNSWLCQLFIINQWVIPK